MAAFFAGVLSLYVLALSAVQRSIEWPDLGLTTWQIVGYYWVMAIVGGSIVGLLRPITRFRLGAFLVGWLVGAVVYSSAWLLLEPDLATFGEAWWIPAGVGLLMGGLAVVWFDEEYRPDAKRGTVSPWVVATVLLAVILILITRVAGWW